MEKISLLIVDRYRLLRKSCGKPAVPAERIRRCRQLHPASDPERCLREQDGRQITQIGLLIMAGFLLYVGAALIKQPPEPVYDLTRPEGGKGPAVYQMEVQGGKGVRLPVEITVEETVYTEQEMEGKFKEAYEEICETMLGENDSLEQVKTALKLPEKALNGLIEADWTSETRELLDDWGQIVKPQDEIPEAGEEGKYRVALSYGELVSEYDVFLMVYPMEKTEEERFLEGLKAEIRQKMEAARSDENVELPIAYEGETLKWFTQEGREQRYVVMFFPAAAVILLIAEKKQRQKEKLRAREREMLLDYPELVSKFTVLVQAGMTARNVWERMVREYEGKKEKGQKPRYAYEEMRITWNQMKNGVYESAAYEEFGRRCGLHSYLKFGALLEQNLRQGTTGLAARLKKEAEEAFEDRKNVARRLGEEAETKMMLPMFMMLFVVLIVIMVPAFLSF